MKIAILVGAVLPVDRILYLSPHQPVLVTVNIEITGTAKLDPRLGISFGIEFFHPEAVTGHIGYKGEVMGLGHVMMNSDKGFILHFFKSDEMLLVHFLGFQRRQQNAAATDDRGAGTVDDIAADGAYIDLGAQHIGRSVFVGDGLTGHELHNGHIQCLG